MTDEQNEPERIWLSPKCDSTSDEGRTWADSDIWGGRCDECEENTAEYVRADKYRALEEAAREAGKQWRLYISGKVSSLAPAMERLAEVLEGKCTT